MIKLYLTGGLLVQVCVCVCVCVCVLPIPSLLHTHTPPPSRPVAGLYLRRNQSTRWGPSQGQPAPLESHKDTLRHPHC